MFSPSDKLPAFSPNDKLRSDLLTLAVGEVPKTGTLRQVAQEAYTRIEELEKEQREVFAFLSETKHHVVESTSLLAAVKFLFHDLVDAQTVTMLAVEAMRHHVNRACGALHHSLDQMEGRAREARHPTEPTVG